MGSSPSHDTCVLKQDTYNHDASSFGWDVKVPCVVIQSVNARKRLLIMSFGMGHTAVYPVCCVLHVKEPSVYRTVKGFAPMVLV